MSKEIDERVVEMRFDNEHFEKNVQTSMSTLEKFKQKLQFKEASKGFDDIDKAAKKTDLSPLAKSADKVGLRFNAMYTIADQAFRNITNSAMAAGKKIINSLTIDPVKTGLSEYETKMNAVQVIKANTRGKFTTEAEQIEAINKALGELNDYADRTIYNYTQMTNNVGKFVAQTGDIEKSVKAVQGLANLAGASGASPEDMARATYQMSQALGGTIRKIDWNSLRNANMAGLELKNMLMDLAKVEGIDIDSMIATKGTFEDTLEEGWLTGDLFMKAMNIYSDAYSEAELAAMGFNEAQIKNFKDLANTAKEATTEVKTFSQLFDVLKETAQSGWTQTWEIIFGDFNTAKKMFTDLQVYFSDILNRFSEARNVFLEGAFNLKNPWSKIYEKLENSSIGKVVKTFDKVSSSIEDASDKLDYFQKIVNDVWRGDYKTSDTGRYEMLEAAGYNHKVVQDLVNKGYNYKLTIEDIEESHKKFGLTLDGNTESMKASGDAAEVTAVKFKEITDEQLKQAGLTDAEIKLYRELADEAERTGVTMLSLVREMSENDGRTMLIDSFKNAWSGLVSILSAVRDAWVDIFPPMTVIQLYNIIKAVKTFSEHLVMNKETQEDLTKTLKGVFAVLDIILTLISLPMKIAFKLLTSLLSVLNVDVLSFTATLGEMLVDFRDWIDSCLDFRAVWEKIIPPIQNAISAFRGWIDSLKESKNLPQDIATGIISWFTKAFTTVTGWFSNLGSLLQNGFSGASDNVIVGLVQGLWNGLKIAGQVIVELGKTIIDKFCEVLGIHSPSTVFIAIGGFIVAGLLMGIKTLFPTVWDTLAGYALTCVDVIKGIDWGSVFSAILSAATTAALLKISQAVLNFSSVFEGLNDMLEDVGIGVKKALKGLGSALKGIGASFRAKAVKDLAISLAILAGALVVLSFIPADKLIAATAAIAVLGIVLGGLFATISLTNKTGEPKELFAKVGAMILTMISIAASILILAKALETISGIDFRESWLSVLLGVLSIVVMMGSIMAALVVTTKFINGVDFAKMAVTITAISGLMLVMAIAMKIFSGLEPGDFGKGIAFVTAFGVIVVALAALSDKTVNMKTAQIGSLIKNVGLAMLLMAVTCKIIAGMTWDEMDKASTGLIGFVGIVAVLMLATRLASDKDVSKAGKLISSVGIAMLLMAFTGKIINSMTWSEMWQAMVGIAAFSAIVAGLLLATRMVSGNDLKKAGATILAVSVAIGVLALVASLLSFMDTEALKKGITAVSVLGLIMAAMILATSKAKNCLGNLIVMTIAITLMASAVATLTLIDTAKLTASAGAMVAMMGAFALMIASTKMMKVGKTTLKNLIVITGIVAILAGIVAALSFINGDKALSSVIPLIALMTAMTAMVLILTKIPIKITKAAKTTLFEMVGIMALLGVMVIALSFIDGNKALVSVVALIALMTAMTTLLIVLTKIPINTANVTTGLLGMVAMMTIFSLFAIALNAIPMDAIAGKKEALAILTLVMAAMSALLVVTSAVGAIYAATGGLAMLGLVGLLAMLAMFVGVAAALNAIPMDTIAGKEEAINIVMGVVKTLGNLLLLLAIVGPLALIGTAALGSLLILISAFAAFVIGVGALMENFPQLQTFVDTGIPVLEKLAYGLGSVISNFMSGMLSELPSIGTSLSDFMDNAQGFISGIKMVDANVLAGVGILVASFAAITAMDFVAGLKKFFSGGESPFASFGEGLKDLSACIIDFANSVGSFTDDQLEAVKRGAEALRVIAEAASAIPNTGGLAGLIMGENDLTDFIGQFVLLADDLNALLDKLSETTIDEATLTKIGNVAKLVKAIIEVANEIPNSGGLAGAMMGNNDLKDFTAQFTLLADDLNYLINELSDMNLDRDMMDKIENVAKIIKHIAEAANAIPNSGKLAGFFAGNNDIDEFIKMLSGSIEDLKSFINGCSGITEGSLNSAKTVISFLTDIITTSSQLDNKSDNKLSDFGWSLVNFVGNFKTFADKMSKVKSDTITNSVSKMKSLMDLCSSFTAESVSNISNFGKALADVGKGGISKFNDEFSKNGNINDSSTAIGNFVTKVADKVKSKTNKNKFISIGKYLVEGITTGITNNTSTATTAIRNLVNDIVEAAQDEAQIESPSKLFKNDVGKWICEGVAEGITEDTSAEEAIKIKMANLYSAYQDYKLKLPDGEKPLGFKTMMENVGLDSMFNENAWRKYTNNGLLEVAAQCYIDVGSEAEKKAEEEAEAVKTANKTVIDTLESEIKKNESEYKLNKLLTFDSDKKKQLTTDYHTNQISAKQKLLDEYKEMKSEYQELSDQFSDAEIAELNNKIITLTEEVGEHQKALKDAENEIAAEEAEKISEKYKEPLDRIKHDLEMLDLTYENWVVSHPNADQYAKRYRLFDHLENELKLLKKREATTKNKLNEVAKTSKSDSEEYKAAYEEWVRARVDMFDKEKEIESAREQHQLEMEEADDRVRETEYSLWVARNKDATKQEQLAREQKYLNECLVDAEEESSKLQQEYLKILEREGENSDLTKQALADWNESEEKVASIRTSISDNKKATLDAAEEADDRLRETEYSLWVARNKDASEGEKSARELQVINDRIVDAEEESAKLYQKYLDIVKKEGEDSTDAKNALADWNENEEKIAEYRNSITDNRKDSLDAAEEANDRVRDSSYELWVSENEDASEHEKLTRKLAHISESIVDAHEDVVKAQEDYNKSLADENATEAERNNLLADLNEKKKKEADLQNQKVDAEKSTLELAKEERSIASEIAKIKYDIWEKTKGRDAEDAEKELKQLEYLNDQLSIQNQITNQALYDYAKANTDYGVNSIESSRAYKAYLDELYNQAELKNEILDLEESAADRQKRLKDKQDLAHTEYEEYIKRYEKYYRANGMSRADLEKDAKLVSGYDPANVVKKITTKTKSALESVTTSTGYQNILTSFTDMGTSYVKAMNDGAASQTEVFINTTTDMVTQCAKKLTEKRPLWVTTGKNLVEGLIQGVTARKSTAIKAAVDVAISMLKEAKDALGINSPSRAFAEIGEYSVLGFVRGLIDNAGLADDAVTNIGDKAIESLKNSIRQISEVVDSDLDAQPTIRPVLDLSNVRSGTARLNAMVSNAQAIAISSSRKAREHSDENQNGNDSTTTAGNTYQFTQNNYSPKALSRPEIYRQTKNQFAALKEVLQK